MVLHGFFRCQNGLLLLAVLLVRVAVQWGYLKVCFIWTMLSGMGLHGVEDGGPPLKNAGLGRVGARRMP